MNNTAFSVDSATVDGELYAFPETGENTYYLVYDKTVITDEDASTLEGVLEACKKAKRKFVIDPGNGFYSCMFAFTGGMSLEGVDENGAQIYNDYDKVAVVDSLEAFSKLFVKYKDVFLLKDPGAVADGLSQNPRTVAAGIDGSWNISAVSMALGDDFGAAKLPTINVKGENKQIISMNGCKLLGVNSRTDYPNAAMALANYLAGEECQVKRLETVSWTPSNLYALDSDAMYSKPANAALAEQANYSVSQSKVASTFWGPMGSLGSKVGQGADRKTLETEFDKAVTAMKDE